MEIEELKKEKKKEEDRYPYSMALSRFRIQEGNQVILEISRTTEMRAFPFGTSPTDTKGWHSFIITLPSLEKGKKYDLESVHIKTYYLYYGVMMNAIQYGNKYKTNGSLRVEELGEGKIGVELWDVKIIDPRRHECCRNVGTEYNGYWTFHRSKPPKKYR